MINRIYSKARRATRWLIRYTTSPWRSLPNFIILGAQKGGTSTLNYYVGKRHPQVRPSMRKEVNYFDRNFHRGLMWYRTYFPLRATLKNGMITGEATPQYLVHPHVPKRIASTVPDVKMIALLRNPKERALSHYQMSVRKGRETLSFDEAVRREEERVGPEWERMFEDEYYESLAFRAFSYKLRGRYAEQLRRFYEYFDPAQILVIASDALKHDTATTLARICSFLGISTPPHYEDSGPRHVRTYGRDMSVETERYLDDYFRPHNEELYNLIDEDFGW